MPWSPFLCREVLHDFATKCTRVKDCLLPEMAKLLELDDDYFIDQFGGKADAYARFSWLSSMHETGSRLRSEASL